METTEFYECNNCKTEFIADHKFGNILCPKCQGTNLRIIL